MGDREGMHPVVIRGIPVALLHHQTESGGGEGAAEGPQALLLRAAPLALPCPIPFLSSWSQCPGIASHAWILPTPTRLESSLVVPETTSQKAGGYGRESKGQEEAETRAACPRGEG